MSDLTGHLGGCHSVLYTTWLHSESQVALEPGALGVQLSSQLLGIKPGPFAKEQPSHDNMEIVGPLLVDTGLWSSILLSLLYQK